MKRLKPIIDNDPNGTWEDWIKKAYLSRISLSATGFYQTPNIGYSFITNSGNPYNYFTYGVACTEVVIDCLTGDHQVCIIFVLNIISFLRLHFNSYFVKCFFLLLNVFRSAYIKLYNIYKN